jgi:hypothetical protein
LFGTAFIPEVSPDGERIMALLSPSLGEVDVVTYRMADGKPDGNRIEIPAGGRSLSRIVIGRGRWMPDGKSVLVLNRDEKGRFGIQAYPFATGTRPGPGSWVIPGLDSSDAVETFGISPDGKRIVAAGVAISNSLMTAANVPGVKRPVAAR